MIIVVTIFVMQILLRDTMKLAENHRAVQPAFPVQAHPVKISAKPEININPQFSAQLQESKAQLAEAELQLENLKKTLSLPKNIQKEQETP